MNERRDDAIDRLLGALQPRSRSVPSSACLDPEILAAWIDNTLPDAPRAKAEAHAASCSRCQALLAAMARTAEAAAAAASVGQPRSRVFGVAPWIAAVGTAAIALVIWAGILPRADRPASETPSSAVQEREAARVEEPKEKSEAPAAPVAQVESERRAFAQTAPKTTPIDAVAGRARSDSEDARNAPARRLSKDTLAGARDESKAPVEAPGATANTKVVAGLSSSAPASVPGTPLPVAATAPPAPPAAAPPPVPPLSTPVNERTQSQQRLADLERARAGSLQESVVITGQAQSPVVVLSPASSVRWQIVKRSIVQFSTDSGVTWTTQAAGAQVPLNGGSAPSANVCWLVGAEGTVLLTLDSGRSWQRVQFPEPIDLVGVTATSADTAIVYASSGKRFATTDRGKSWH